MDFSQMNGVMIAFFLLLFLLGLIYAFIVMRFGGLWLQCYMSRVPILFVDLRGIVGLIASGGT